MARKDDIFPRLRLREVIVVLLVVAGGITALIWNAVATKAPHLAGPAANRLKLSHGTYWMRFPRDTTIGEARAAVLRTFPKDSHTIDYTEKAFCDRLIITSNRLSALGFFPGVVNIEFLTGRSPSKITLVNERDVNLALITLLESPDQRPSC